MPKKKANIKEILAANLRENRRKKGLTQEKLAEMADISLRYLAMLELGNSFPSGEMVEKLAKALDIQAFQLFNSTATTEGALLHLEQSIVANIEKVVSTALKQSENDRSPKEEMELLKKEIVHEIKETVSNAVKQSLAEESKKQKKKRGD